MKTRPIVGAVAAMLLVAALLEAQERRTWEEVRRGFPSVDLFDERMPLADRDALANALADLVIADTTSAEVRYLATKELAWAALRGGASRWEIILSPEVGHGASYEALQRIFGAVNPPPVCVSGGNEVLPGRIGCEGQDPTRTPWCEAGRVLHGAEVDRKRGFKPGHGFIEWVHRPSDPQRCRDSPGLPRGGGAAVGTAGHRDKRGPPDP